MTIPSISNRDAHLRGWIASLPADEVDRAVERYLGIEEAVPSDAPGDELIGYHASGVAQILEMLSAVPVRSRDTVIDLGSGLGKVVLLTRLLTNATVRGVDIQQSLVDRARAAAVHLGVDVTFEHGDIREAALDDGTVFFLYAPFTGAVLADVLNRLKRIALQKPIVVCALGMELDRAAPWLVARPTDSFWLTIYDSHVF